MRIAASWFLIVLGAGAGTWIDLHLSRTSFEDAASSWRKLRDVLKGIEVSEKKEDQ